MKANLILFFEYEEKPENEKEKELSDLLISFGEFCENNYFQFQSIPRIGEYITAESLLRKWIENKEYKKPCSDGKAFNKIYRALKTGSFKVERVFHSLESCTIHCSDIEYQKIE